ncbi:hypothetical protein BHM03_00025672 [Ensete ventricosum]|nr:hypothetical protein BHM03_00025672 [Ensete ventricosum]
MGRRNEGGFDMVGWRKSVERSGTFTRVEYQVVYGRGGDHRTTRGPALATRVRRRRPVQNAARHAEASGMFRRLRVRVGTGIFLMR